jgi:Major capsid protein N-terminus/Large eukaryotic DNA virus major capsid protein
MAGGLFNIVSVGNANVILTGNPTKTFFRCVYSKYTNFGLQKFRIDYEGLRELRLTDSATFTFKIPRYAELLMDTYLVVSLPDIWSPIYPPVRPVSVGDSDGSENNNNGQWAPYEFKWIENLGSVMIEEVTITCGNLTLQRYSGEYLAALVERDFNAEKKALYNAMTGNVPELNNPANCSGRENVYPSAFYTTNAAGAEPSIRGRTLYIPINTWFTLDSRCAFPLVSLQYNELVITVTIRPIQEIVCVRDVFDAENNYPYIQPDFTKQEFQMYRYLQTPPSVNIAQSDYGNKNSTWKSNVHLISTYCFLSKEERELFASQEQIYLVKDVYEYRFNDVTGSKKVKLLNSNGMIANWMWFFRRNDAYMRNQWTNYTNWPYNRIPKNIDLAPQVSTYQSWNGKYYGPAKNPPLYNSPIHGTNTGYFISGDYTSDNHKEILETMGVVLNGEYRENMLTRGVFDYIEKYTRTQGFAKEGLYCYNFCLNTSPFEYQPSGAINMSKFKTIELEVTTHTPTLTTADINNNVQYGFICDNSGNIIGIRKQNWKLFDYTYDMVLFEERYNVLTIIGGNCGMLYAR